jgi:hypothetical protein
MRTRQFWVGVLLGLVLGALIAIGIDQFTPKPVYLTISGTPYTDSASHEETQLDNRIFFSDPQIKGMVYLDSKTIDLNDQYKFVGRSVQASGQLNVESLSRGGSILTLDAKTIDAKP